MKFVKYILLIVSLCLLFTACKKECVHEYQSAITQAATCTQEGVETFTCVHCQQSYTQPIPIIEHSYDAGKVENAATCTEEGVLKYTCTSCAATKTEPIEKLPHTIGNITVTKEPNCTEEGEKSGTCAVCGVVEITEKIPTNDVHIFTNTVIREATCTEKGEGVNTCTLCQHTESCQYELKEHSYGKEKVLQKATCTADGEKQYSCTQCGKIRKESIPATGHKWKGTSCTSAGVCTECNATGKKTDHKYTVVSDRPQSNFYAGERKKKCETCGDEKMEYYTKTCAFTLDEISQEIADYAEKLGFNTRIEEFDPDNNTYRDSRPAWDIDMYGKGTGIFVDGGKTGVDSMYELIEDGAAPTSAYTIVINTVYSKTGTMGGYFIVYVELEN